MKNGFILVVLIIGLLTGCTHPTDPQPQIAVDPATIIEGVYTMNYIESKGVTNTLPKNGVSGTVSFNHLIGPAEKFGLTVSLNGTPYVSATTTVYIKGTSNASVDFYNEAALLTKIGSATRNNVDIEGLDSTGTKVVLKAFR